jgi:hypothetical protein
MANATPSRLGQVQGAGDPRQLFEKVFAGEVLTAFETNVILKPLTEHKTISSGKSASFPAIYKASAQYHTPGVELTGTAIQHNEVVISVDDQLIADTFIANIDEAMNHYDVRSPYSTELGLALALVYDKNVGRNIARAARGDALFSADSGGSQITDADSKTSATSLAASIWAGKQTMEEADVPVEALPVQCTVKPAQWYLLAQESTLVLNRDVDGDGSYSKGSFSMIGGVNVSRSNAMPFADASADTSIPAPYRMNMANTSALIFVSRAAATVQLIGLATEEIYDGRRQGTLMLGKIAVGHGPLINKAAVEVITS